MQDPVVEGFLDAFGALSNDLPGTAKVTAARREAMAKFEELGLPHRRVEEWKYTDLRARITQAFPVPASGDAKWPAIETAIGALGNVDAARMVIVDGHYAADLSDPETAGDTVMVKPLREALADGGFTDMHATIANVPAHDTTVSLNTALMTDGVAVHVAATPAKALHIIHVTNAADTATVTTRNIISVADDAEVTIMETFVSLDAAPSLTNTLTHLGIGPDANVLHVKVQGENTATTHLATWAVELAEKSRYRTLQLTTGGGLTRNQIYLSFNGADATAHMNATYLQRASQHCDSTLVVDHIAPGCESRELYKGVLDDSSRGVFQGKIMVKPEAQKTDGKQMAQALLLSDEAEFDSKPELEIFADDVVCGHGSTSGAIDEEQLFYLRARGIPEKMARALLIEAFAGEAIEIVEDDEPLHDALMTLVRNWFSEE